MRLQFAYLIIFGLLLGAVPGRVSAIATADLLISESAPTNIADSTYNSFKWDFVYNYRTSSAVAVDHYWLLTAAHVADDTQFSSDLVINGEIYTQTDYMLHDTADLALVKFDKPFPGYYLLHGGEIFHEEQVGSGRFKQMIDVYDPLIMCGFGRTGAVTQTTFSNGPGGAWTKRWGSNEGSGLYASLGGNVGGEAGTVSTLCFHTDFNTVDTPYEAGATQHDSGSPAFINQGDGWRITGILLNLSGPSGGPYNGNYMAHLKNYAAWVTNSIPDYDTDMDGLPDHWEASTGESESDLDPDEDGFSNYEEWIADTDPNLGSSFLEVMEFTNGTDLAFSSSTNRTYQVEQSDHLTNTVWVAATGWFEGSAPTTSTNMPVSGSNLFYRIRAKLR